MHLTRNMSNTSSVNSENCVRWQQGRVAFSCAPVRALLRTHGLESTLMQRCAPDWLNFALICNISDGLLDYAKVTAYLATHSQTNTYQSPQNRWHSSSHSPPAQTSYRLPCWIVALRHYITWLSPQVRRFFVIQEYLVRSRGCRRCIKECAVAQVTGAFLNATPLRRGIVFVFVTCLFIILFVRNVTWNKYHHETFRRSMTLYQWIRHLAAPATGRGTRFAVHCDLIISTIRSMITVQQERYCFCVCNLFVYHPVC